MKYYKDKAGQVYAFELDGSQDDLIGDKVLMTDAEVEAHLNPPLTIKQTIAIYEQATQYGLDNFAQSGGYDSVLSCVSYANSTNAKFKSDALKMIALRDATWLKSVEIMNKVQAGDKPIPSLTEYKSLLPVLSWD